MPSSQRDIKVCRPKPEYVNYFSELHLSGVKNLARIKFHINYQGESLMSFLYFSLIGSFEC